MEESTDQKAKSLAAIRVLMTKLVTALPSIKDKHDALEARLGDAEFMRLVDVSQLSVIETELKKINVIKELETQENMFGEVESTLVGLRRRREAELAEAARKEELAKDPFIIDDIEVREPLGGTHEEVRSVVEEGEVVDEVTFDAIDIKVPEGFFAIRIQFGSSSWGRFYGTTKDFVFDPRVVTLQGFIDALKKVFTDPKRVLSQRTFDIPFNADLSTPCASCKEFMDLHLTSIVRTNGYTD